jgi:hypothetical protein
MLFAGHHIISAPPLSIDRSIGYPHTAVADAGTDDRPLWRQMFDAAERSIGSPLEAQLESPEFLAFVSAVTRLQRAATRVVEDAAATSLHAFGLPALTDVRGLSRHLARLERRVRDLQEQLEDLGERENGGPT